MKNLNFRKIFYLSIMLFIISLHSIGQLNNPSEITNSYFENLILNTDRNLYFSGEKIWFKINGFVDGANNDSILSNIVYLELYDYKTTSIAKAKFRIINGETNGFISIPSGLGSGNYFLRAYTLFMRNYSPYLFPSSIISIINPDKHYTNDVSDPENDILIVPEGGKLIAGIPSKIAIRFAIGLARQIDKIAVVNQEKEELVQTSLARNGLALLKFEPTNKKYFLKLIFKNGHVGFTPLPNVVNQGIVIHSLISNSQLNISLLSNGSINDAEKTEYHLELKSANLNNLLTRKIIVNETISIPSLQLSNGINYIILKNAKGEVLDVSAKYFSTNKKIEIMLQTEEREYQPRSLINLKVPDWNSVDNHDFVISVTKRIPCTIINKLLPVNITYCPSLISNYINSTTQNLDSMISQIETALILYHPQYNTKEFIENLAGEKNIKWLPEIRDVSISGRVMDKKTNLSINNTLVYCAVFGENKQFHICKTNEDGQFVFSLNHLTQKQNVFICIKPVDSLNAELFINKDYSDKYPQSQLIPLDIDSVNLNQLEKMYINAQVNNAFASHTDRVDDKLSFYPLIEKEQEISVFLKDFIKIPVMSEVFDEIVPFVSTKEKKGTFYLNIFDDRDNQIYEDPFILIDGIPVFDINQVMKISPELIEKISVTKRKFYIGKYTLNGIINITTKTKNFAGISFPEESVFLEYQCVMPQSCPIFPNYDKELKNSRIPDFRNLLLWKTELKTSTSNGLIKFYSSDHCGKYDVIIRGYNSNGQYSLGTSEIEIKKMESDLLQK